MRNKGAEEVLRVELTDCFYRLPVHTVLLLFTQDSASSEGTGSLIALFLGPAEVLINLSDAWPPPPLPTLTVLGQADSGVHTEPWKASTWGGPRSPPPFHPSVSPDVSSAHGFILYFSRLRSTLCDLSCGEGEVTKRTRQIEEERWSDFTSEGDLIGCHLTAQPSGEIARRGCKGLSFQSLHFCGFP